jgi:hypothetical protein
VACAVVTLDAPAFERYAAQARLAGTGETVPSDPEADELTAKRVRALRHALAEYELPAFSITPGRALGEILVR